MHNMKPRLPQFFPLIFTLTIVFMASTSFTHSLDLGSIIWKIS